MATQAGSHLGPRPRPARQRRPAAPALPADRRRARRRRRVGPGRAPTRSCRPSVSWPSASARPSRRSRAPTARRGAAASSRRRSGAAPSSTARPRAARPASSTSRSTSSLATPFGGELAAAAATIDPHALASLLEYQPHGGSERHRRIMASNGSACGACRRRRTRSSSRPAPSTASWPRSPRSRGPGDAVLAEAVTYTGLISLAKHLHLQLVPVAIDAGGIDVDAFARAAKRSGARSPT